MNTRFNFFEKSSKRKSWVKISCLESVGVSAVRADETETTVYDIGGRPTGKDAKGLSIRRKSDGTARKVVKG